MPPRVVRVVYIPRYASQGGLGRSVYTQVCLPGWLGEGIMLGRGPPSKVGERESCWEEGLHEGYERGIMLGVLPTHHGTGIHTVVYTLPTHPGYTISPTTLSTDLSTADRKDGLPR